MSGDVMKVWTDEAEVRKVLEPGAEAGAKALRKYLMETRMLLESLGEWPCAWIHPWLTERAQPGMVRTQWATYLSERVG